jgi:hypothetical protein
MRRVVALLLLGLLSVLFAFITSPRQTVGAAGLPASNPTALPATLSGVVTYPQGGPAGGVTVQVKGTANKTTTAKNGAYTLRGITWDAPVTITAYAPFYKIGWVTLDPTSKDWKGVPASVDIALKALPATDNYEYPWFSFEGVSGSASCALCHRENSEWNLDAHAQAAKNPRFITIYKGTNMAGQVGQRTLYGNEGAALPPDPSQPHYGPGYKLDEPTRNGNCAACHTPLAARISTEKNCGWSGCHTNLTSERATRKTMDAGVSPLDLTGDAGEGITCDFCHKIGDVILDPKTKLPLADRPGIVSMKLYRPQDGDQVFFGPFGDVSRRVSYSPLQEKSEFCAPCHYGVFGGVVGDGQVTGGTLIYNSYGEWLDSPYSNPRTGKTCQQCHMPVLDTKVSVFPQQGGIEREYVNLHDHRMPGAADEQLLQNSVTMNSQAWRSANNLEVLVRITNDQAGHHIPTDAPIREMILVVEAVDAAGKPLALKQGPVLPDYSGNYAGQPGKSFAKILKDEWTGETPTAAYWRPVTIVEDTRLAAMATDATRYTFAMASGEAAQVRVKLVFRRAFEQLAKQKGWNDPDILMEESIIQVKK